MPPIAWTSEDSFEIAGTEYISDQYGIRRATEPTRFCLAKVPRVIDRYAQLLDDLAPRTIVEIGILEGASTALFADLAEPDKLVAIDWAEAPTAKLQEFITRRGFEDMISVHGGVDQADADRLREIVHAELGDRDLDLVIDDASHVLGPTRATFNCLFPRLRPGGTYVVEDWATGLMVGGPTPLRPDERPLVELLSEVIVAKGRHPRLVGDVTVRAGWAVIERGDSPVDGPFDVADGP